MKFNQFYLLLAAILMLPSCKSEFQVFCEKAVDFAKNDTRINQSEYEILLKDISVSDEKGFQQFKNGKDEIDNSKVASYLVKYFTAKKLTLTASDIWQPETNTVKEQPFNVNVFLENSASMDGYVKGITEFETAIYNLLGDFKISGLCDSLNLNYINSQKIPFPPDIEDFIEKLEPSTFKKRGGDRSVSDLKNILNTVLHTVNDKNVAVLVSDFVFSSGRNANAQEYLNSQEVGIKIDFAEKLKEFDLSVVVIQLQSNFDNFYYDKTDKPLSFKGKRPYYVWIFGSTQHISTLLGKKILDNIKGGYLNRLVFQSIKRKTEPNYRIQYSPKIGSFNAAQLPNKIITDASVSTSKQSKGLFGFNVAVDFSKNLQDANYFRDTANYILSNDKYQLKVEPITDKNNLSLSDFTHLLTLQTTELREEPLRIEVIGKTPTWVYNSTSTDDSNFLKDSNEQRKTFGLKYLVEGVSEAFYPKTSLNAINTITISIKK